MNYFEKLAREAAEAQAEERREARRQRTEKILVRLIGEAIFQPKDKRAAAPQVDAENGARLVSLSEDLHDLLHAVGRVVQLLAVAEEEAEARP